MAGEERLIQMKHTNILGANIRRIRKAKNLKAVDVLAYLQLEGIEISSSSYTKIEKGTNNPTVEFIIAVKNYFECEYDELFRQANSAANL